MAVLPHPGWRLRRPTTSHVASVACHGRSDQASMRKSFGSNQKRLLFLLDFACIYFWLYNLSSLTFGDSQPTDVINDHQLPW